MQAEISLSFFLLLLLLFPQTGIIGFIWLFVLYVNWRAIVP